MDPNVKNDRTREFIVGFDRQVGAGMAVGASYIWRKYDRFVWNDRINFTSCGLSRGELPADDLPRRRALRSHHVFRAKLPDPVAEHLHERPDR